MDLTKNTNNLLKLLDGLKFPNTKRPAIGDEPVKTVTFGFVRRRFTSYDGPSVITEMHPEIWDAIIKYAKSLDPEFVWTTCTINKNVKSKPHKDKKNFGLTLIIGLGNYQGGNLSVKIDDVVQNIDIHNKPYYFDGYNNEHWTCDFTGDRYSLMFYNYR